MSNLIQCLNTEYSQHRLFIGYLLTSIILNTQASELCVVTFDKSSFPNGGTTISDHTELS